MSRLRLGLSVFGLVLAVIGAVRDSRPLVWAAIGVIGIALILRIWSAKKQ